MSFDAIDYAHKRVRQQGSREWKLWFNETAEGLQFRVLTKDRVGDCYETLTGIALASTGDHAHIRDDDNDDAYFTDMFRYASEKGTIQIYLEIKTRELAWVQATGDYATADCSLGTDVPLMPEMAG
jgi:hypothetical protein